MFRIDIIVVRLKYWKQNAFKFHFKTKSTSIFSIFSFSCHPGFFQGVPSSREVPDPKLLAQAEEVIPARLTNRLMSNEKGHE